MNLLLVTTVNILVVAVAVLIHYEVLYKLHRWLPKSNVHHRFRIVVGLAGALMAHVAEVWVFAVAYYIMVFQLGWGKFSGAIEESNFFDCFYFSFTTYTTLGFGDIQPYGDVRYLTGIESLTGLVLITWTASFLYLEMQNHWQNN